MKRFVSALVASLSLACAGSAAAQPTAADCSNLMKFGIYDRFNTMTAESRFRQVQSFIQSYDFGTREATRDRAAEFGFVIDDILSLDFDGEDSSTDFAEWKKAFLSMSFETASSQGLTATHTETISPRITELVGTCLTSAGTGVQAAITPAADRETFTYTVSFRPSGSVPTAKGTVTVTPATVAAGCAPVGQVGTPLEVGPAGFSLSCKRLPSETVTILFNTTEGNKAVTYEAYQVPEPVIAFTTSRDRVVQGETVTLTWNVANASKVEFEGQGQVQPTGQLVVQPSQTTTYRLFVTSLRGATLVKPVPVIVDVPPTLVSAEVRFRVTNDNKDFDTDLFVSLICAGNAVATSNITEDREWKDNTDQGPFAFTVTSPIRRSNMADCRAQLNERPNGDDEFHFRWSVKLTFSDGSVYTTPEGGGNVDSDRPDAHIDFRP